MQISEAIILAGGSGTRLQGTVPGLPKCLAPVNGKPFLHYLISHLLQQGISRFIFALGHQSYSVIEYLNSEWPLLLKVYSVEDSPLGTGGAIQKAITHALSENVFITNGDTIFKASLAKAAVVHQVTYADFTLLLKPMQHPYRYGTVTLNHLLRVTSFHEKQIIESGLINAGSYLLNTRAFTKTERPSAFSFEKDFLEQSVHSAIISGYQQDAYFIDIGIPADYQKAQEEYIHF